MRFLGLSRHRFVVVLSDKGNSLLHHKADDQAGHSCCLKCVYIYICKDSSVILDKAKSEHVVVACSECVYQKELHGYERVYLGQPDKFCSQNSREICLHYALATALALEPPW